MCLAIPTLIKSIEGTTARAEIGGVERVISLALTPEAGVGDYVLLHTGFAIGVVDEGEAQETLRLLEELAEFYTDGVIAAENGTADADNRHPRE